MNNPKPLLERAKIWFEQWFQNLKIKCGKWRVAQNVRRSLLGTAYVDLQLDHTRILSEADNAEDVEDLDYIPSIVDIYANFSRQIGQTMQPPAVAFISCEQLSIPLTDAEKEEERETTMYIEMFSVAESEHSQALVVQTQVEPKVNKNTMMDLCYRRAHSSSINS